MSSHTVFAQLRDALASLYITERDARRVASDAGLDLRRIEFGSHAINNWHSILTEAVESSKEDAVLKIALGEKPDYPPLLVAHATYRQFTDDGGRLDAPSSLGIDTRIELANQITESVTNILTAMQAVEANGRITQDEYDRAFREWEKQRASIRTYIKAYFPETQLAQEWATYGKMVTEVYALSGTNDPGLRKWRLEQLQDYFGIPDSAVETLLQIELRRAGFPKAIPYQKAWGALREQAIAKKEELIDRILSAPTAAM